MIGGSEMQLPDSVHAARPWRIHDILGDFKLQDVWALPTPGGPDDFRHLLEQMAAGDPSKFSSTPARVLFAIRWKVGELLGWDDEDAGLGSRVPTLRDRLPADLRDGLPLPEFEALPFESLYLTDDEWAGEIANRTVHGVMHLGWVPDPEAEGGYRGEMAVYVKPNGLLGSVYMAAIDPFRHYVVYPPMLREMGRRWRQPSPNGTQPRSRPPLFSHTWAMPRLGQTVPALPARSVPKAVAFYRERLGFEVVHEDEGFAILARDDAEIHLWGSSDETWRLRHDLVENPICSGAESFIGGTASCRIATEGIDELYAELRAKDVLHSSTTAVEDTDYGTREFAALDIDGNLLSFFTRVMPRK